MGSQEGSQCKDRAEEEREFKSGFLDLPYFY